MLNVRAKYSPGWKNYDGGYQEIRWDLFGCNLSCSFCWSPASRPPEISDPLRAVTSEEVVSITLDRLGEQSCTFFRFTGGEPTLQWDGLAEVLTQLQTALMPPRPPILIQTNGIAIGRGEVDLSSLSEDREQNYLFEISFKGTNAAEFSLLTNRPAELYQYQLAGYQRLLDLSQTSPHIQVVAVLGVYHSSIRGLSKYAFVNQRSGNLFFDQDESWDSDFSELWISAPLKWVEPLRLSPLGIWRNVLHRCGESGSGVLQYSPSGRLTNQRGLFTSKPKSSYYARQLVLREFWR